MKTNHLKSKFIRKFITGINKTKHKKSEKSKIQKKNHSILKTGKKLSIKKTNIKFLFDKISFKNEIISKSLNFY